MANQKNLKIDALDFIAIRDNFRTYLKGQDQFSDYDFDSSGLSFFLDVLAYNTYYNAFYVNFVANESFLSTAQKRDSVVNLARSLNYTPRSAVSSRITGDLVITASDPDNTFFFSIPKYSKFSATLNDNEYTFMNTSAVTVLKDSSNNFIYEDITLYEGREFTEKYRYSETNKNQRFLIQNSNANIETLSVKVFNSNTDNTERVFTRATNLIYLDSSSEVFFVEEVEDGKFELFFGDGFFGKKLDDGNIIQIDYILTSGSEANGIRQLESKVSLAGASDISFIPYSSSTTGDDKESIEKIRFNAPKAYAAQNRIVTIDDFSAVLLQQPNVDSVIVWGGEDNDPPQYGKVFISIKPKVNEILTDKEKNDLINYVLYPKKMITITPEIVDPEYIYLALTVNVKFDARKNTLSSSSMVQAILDSIDNYNTEELSTFGKYYRNSSLTRAIDFSERSILSSNVSVKLKKEVNIQLGTSTRYEINFANAIDDITSQRPASHPFNSGNKLSSNEFTYNGYPYCYLEENGGVIRIFRRFGSNFVGVVANAGTINYETGKVILTKFSPEAFADGSNKLKLTAIPKDIDILSLRNQIVTIKMSEVSINLIDDNTINLVKR